MENKTLKQEIINKLKQLKEDLNNTCLIDNIYNIVSNNFDKSNFAEFYDNAYITNQLCNIKWLQEKAKRLKAKGDIDFAQLYFNDTEYSIVNLIQYVQNI